ncbi:MAG: cation:proton antiporter [bacterium]|nr:MAG: cation:proton antiporter [bacterium]
MEIPLLKDIIIILGLSMVVLYLGNRLKIPAIVGYLLTGMVCGPAGFALVKAIHEVEIMAEIGIILLLFTLGLEFSLSKLSRLKKAVLVGGTVQVFLSITAVTGIFLLLDLNLTQALFLGFLVALSSTAIILKILQEKAAIDTPHGNSTIGILIFQDIIIVPMILLTPLLAGSESENFSTLLFGAKIVTLFILLFVAQKWLIPFVLHQVTRTRNRELFLVSIAFLAFAIAWLTSQIGLSLALGAFLSGLLISESEYSHSALTSMLPLRDIFIGFFFVSVGMLLNFQTVIDYPGLILILFGAILLLKFTTGFIAILIMRYPLRVALLVGVTLAQIGEFSFILSKTGMEYDLLNDTFYQLFLAVSVLSMMATPFLMSLDQVLIQFADRFPLPKSLASSRRKEDTMVQLQLQDHLIIVGYGLNGKNLARTALSQKIPHVVIDINPETIRDLKKAGIPSFYGDASYLEVLRRAKIESARILVIVINDSAASRRIIQQAKYVNPNIYIIVRTRFFQEVDELFKLGAEEVFPEEFETSIGIFSSVLKKYLTPENQILQLSNEIRAEGYKILRHIPAGDSVTKIVSHSDLEVQVVEIDADCQYLGKRLADLDLENTHHLQSLVVLRGTEVLTRPMLDLILTPGDRLMVLGKPEDIQLFLKNLQTN